MMGFGLEAWEVGVRIVAPGGEKAPALDEERGGEEEEGGVVVEGGFVVEERGQGECVFAVGS